MGYAISGSTPPFSRLGVVNHSATIEATKKGRFKKLYHASAAVISAVAFYALGATMVVAKVIPPVLVIATGLSVISFVFHTIMYSKARSSNHKESKQDKNVEEKKPTQPNQKITPPESSDTKTPTKPVKPASKPAVTTINSTEPKPIEEEIPKSKTKHAAPADAEKALDEAESKASGLTVTPVQTDSSPTTPVAALVDVDDDVEDASVNDEVITPFVDERLGSELGDSSAVVDDSNPPSDSPVHSGNFSDAEGSDGEGSDDLSGFDLKGINFGDLTNKLLDDDETETPNTIDQALTPPLSPPTEETPVETAVNDNESEKTPENEKVIEVPIPPQSLVIVTEEEEITVPSKKPEILPTAAIVPPLSDFVTQTDEPVVADTSGATESKPLLEIKEPQTPSIPAETKPTVVITPPPVVVQTPQTSSGPVTKSEPKVEGQKDFTNVKKDGKTYTYYYYHVLPTEQAVKNIEYMMHSLGTMNLIKLQQNESKIKKAGDTLNIHPLRFLAYVSQSPELCPHLKKLWGYKGGFLDPMALVFNNFKEGFTKKFGYHKIAGTLDAASLEQFANDTGLDLKKLKTFVLYKEFDKMFDYIVETSIKSSKAK